jgi:hypothetical protein
MSHYTVKGIVQQNRVAERVNITFLEMARIMLSNVNLSKELKQLIYLVACLISLHQFFLNVKLIFRYGLLLLLITLVGKYFVVVFMLMRLMVKLSQEKRSVG